MKAPFRKPSSLLVLAALTLTMVSCDKDEDMEDMGGHGGGAAALNINYPAAYVVNGSSNYIDVIKLSDMSHVDHIGLNGGTFPHHIYKSPDNMFLAVAITGTDLSGGHAGHATMPGAYSVVIIDPTTGELHHSIPTEHLPHNAAFSPNSSELWFGQADSLDGMVFVHSTSDFSEVAAIPVGMQPSEVTFSADGSKVFAANTGSGTVSVIDPVSKTVVATIPVGQMPVGAWPASNGMMYVDNEMDETVSEISVSGLNVVSTINLGFMPGYVAYLAGTQELWVSDATNGRVVWYTNSGGAWTEQGSFTTGANAHAIAFNADGSIGYVTNQDANTLSIVATATHTVTSTVDVGMKPNGIVLKE